MSLNSITKGAEMKCFQVDESNWYAGETAEQAQSAYVEDIGEEAREYMDDFGEPEEITDMDLCVMDDDEPKGYKLGELLTKMEKPGFIASTEY